MRNNFLTVQKPNGRSDYIDLYNLRSYREKPEVRRFGDVEMLKVGRMYYSRTKKSVCKQTEPERWLYL